MIRADVDGVPFWHRVEAPGDRVRGQLQRWRGRKDVGPAREIFLEDIVLRRALQLAPIRALLLRQRCIERDQPRGRRVDGHRGVHPIQRQAVEQRAHVAQMADRHADFADFAARQFVVAVVAGLGWQIERNRKPGLALGEIGFVELVGLPRRRMPGIGAENPGRIGGVLKSAHRGGRKHARHGESKRNVALQHRRSLDVDQSKRAWVR